MKQFLGDAEYDEFIVDPFAPKSIRSMISGLIDKMPSSTKIGFNLTGGTKLMFAGALAECRKVNATPFYFNSRSNEVVFLNDFKSISAKRIQSVETFIKLNGNDLFISNPGCWNKIPGTNNSQRLELTKHLWNEKRNITGLYRKLTAFNDHPGKVFAFKHKNIFVELAKDNNARIIIRSKNGEKRAYQFENWSNFARYLTGGWFEEYVYIKLKPLCDKGLIRDLRIGLQVSFKGQNKGTKSLGIKNQILGLFGANYQELDLSFTDGRRLYIVECKAGSVKGEYVRKLESITRYFGGIEGQGILACCFPPNHPVIKKKANEAHNINLFSGNSLFNDIEKIIRKNGS